MPLAIPVVRPSKGPGQGIGRSAETFETGVVVMNEFLQANWGSVTVLAVILALFLLLRNRATRISGLDEVLEGVLEVM